MKLRKPSRSGPPSEYGTRPVFEHGRVYFTGAVSFIRPASLRALSKWLLKCEAWMTQEEQKRKLK